MSTCLRDKVIGHWLHIIPGGGCVELWLGTNQTQPFTNLSWQSLHVPSALCPRVLAMQLKQTRGSSGGWMHGGICCNPKRLFYVCSMMIVNSVHDPSSILLFPVPSSSQPEVGICRPSIDYEKPRAHQNMIVNHNFIRLMSHFFELINNKQVLYFIPPIRSPPVSPIY